MMIEHSYKGDDTTCLWCNQARSKHRKSRQRPDRQDNRIHHIALGDPCEKCNQPAQLHDSQSVVTRRKERDQKRPNRQAERTIIGIDGEGKDMPDGRHVYTLLCAVNENGKVVAEVENQDGLSSIQCFDMLLSLPRNTLKFIFMGSYDWTKIIEDLELTDIYYIMHPNARKSHICRECKKTWSEGKVCPKCSSEKVRVITKVRRIQKDRYGNECQYGLDWFNGSFSVKKPIIPWNARHRWEKSVKVWDCFKFFQSSFVKAIELWKVATPEQLKRISSMKDKRGEFAEESPDDIRHYCREECHLLAQMMRKLIDACEVAGITLKRYEGAGSIANALMKENHMKDFMGPSLEQLETLYPGIYIAIMSAYFGGRFEDSVVGAVNKPVWNRDIHSAYPYALSMLPCLTCGTWKYVRKDAMNLARKGTLAVIHFRIKSCTVKERVAMAWAPLPCRQEDGSICFPTGFEGWAWMPEMEAALRGWSDVIEVLEAFVYTTTCEHKPWHWMPDAYRKRCEWGKDGPGIVMKLGTNACAGKTMQVAGDPPPFKSWIWGGMTTATTRAQALDGITTAKDRWNILAIATDGLFSTEALDLPKPKDTGTNDLQKPLGDWGSDYYETGVFFVKPGMYFNDSCKLMRARGVGRKELNKQALALCDAFKKWNRKSTLQIQVKSRRFYGARSSILAFSSCIKCNTTWPGLPSNKCPKCNNVGDAFRTQIMRLKDTDIPAYGRWDVRPIDIKFATLPKRETVTGGDTYGRMRIRDMRPKFGGEISVSLPYLPGVTTPEGLAARQTTEEALEEPDWNDADDLI